MFFLALVTLGTVILELNPRRNLEGTGQHPADTRDVGSNTQRNCFLDILLVCMGEVFRVRMFGYSQFHLSVSYRTFHYENNSAPEPILFHIGSGPTLLSL